MSNGLPGTLCLLSGSHRVLGKLPCGQRDCKPGHPGGVEAWGLLHGHPALPAVPFPLAAQTLRCWRGEPNCSSCSSYCSPLPYPLFCRFRGKQIFCKYTFHMHYLKKKKVHSTVKYFQAHSAFCSPSRQPWTSLCLFYTRTLGSSDQPGAQAIRFSRLVVVLKFSPPFLCSPLGHESPEIARRVGNLDASVSDEQLPYSLWSPGPLCVGRRGAEGMDSADSGV